MARSCLIWLACAACMSPAMPAAHVAPTPDRYQHAADPDPAVRARAADELVGDPSIDAANALVGLEQHDREPQVRIAAAGAIAERRDPNLDESLRNSSTTDPDPNVRAAAAESHEKLWPWAKSPHTALGFAMLCPGCGHFYLHEPGEGAAILAAAVTLVGSGYALTAGHTATLDGASDSPQVPLGLVLGSWGQDLWFYSIFDAYRDARVLRGDFGYRHKITRETLGDLASAPFRPSVLESPWVWAGVPLALALGIGVGYLANQGQVSPPSIFEVRNVNFFGKTMSRGAGFAAGTAYYAALFDPVGVGEESLFRGVIQTELEERFGTYGGLAMASAIFGAVHLVNFGQDPKQALYAVPTIAVLGGSLGLAYIHTGYKLETSVAMHFWYDFLLSTIGFAMDPNHQPFVVQYGTSM